MATGTRGTTPPSKTTKPKGTRPTGSGGKNKFTPTRTRKTFTPGPTPKQIDRFQLIAIIRASAQSPDAIPDPALDALADAAMLSREVVKTYYKQCWQRMFEIYRTMYTQPLPPPSFDDIDPGF